MGSNAWMRRGSSQAGGTLLHRPPLPQIVGHARQRYKPQETPQVQQMDGPAARQATQQGNRPAAHFLLTAAGTWKHIGSPPTFYRQLQAQAAVDTQHLQRCRRHQRLAQLVPGRVVLRWTRATVQQIWGCIEAEGAAFLRLTAMEKRPSCGSCQNVGHRLLRTHMRSDKHWHLRQPTREPWASHAQAHPVRAHQGCTQPTSLLAAHLGALGTAHGHHCFWQHSHYGNKCTSIHAAHLEALGVAHGQHSKVG